MGELPVRLVSKDVIQRPPHATVDLGWGLYAVPPLIPNGVNAFYLITLIVTVAPQESPWPNSGCNE